MLCPREVWVVVKLFQFRFRLNNRRRGAHLLPRLTVKVTHVVMLISRSGNSLLITFGRRFIGNRRVTVLTLWLIYSVCRVTLGDCRVPSPFCWVRGNRSVSSGSKQSIIVLLFRVVLRVIGWWGQTKFGRWPRDRWLLRLVFLRSTIPRVLIGRPYPLLSKTYRRQTWPGRQIWSIVKSQWKILKFLVRRLGILLISSVNNLLLSSRRYCSIYRRFGHWRLTRVVQEIMLVPRPGHSSPRLILTVTFSGICSVSLRWRRRPTRLTRIRSFRVNFLLKSLRKVRLSEFVSLGRAPRLSFKVLVTRIIGAETKLCFGPLVRRRKTLFLISRSSRLVRLR